MRRCKRFLLILMALWLPLQAAAAAAMPFCSHAAEAPVQTAVQTAAAQPPGHCLDHVPRSGDHVAEASGGDLACDNCEMCHLASSGYLPVAAASLTLAAASSYMALPAPTPLSHIGDPPLQPPRRLH